MMRNWRTYQKRSQTMEKLKHKTDLENQALSRRAGETEVQADDTGLDERQDNGADYMNNPYPLWYRSVSKCICDRKCNSCLGLLINRVRCL